MLIGSPSNWYIGWYIFQFIRMVMETKKMKTLEINYMRNKNQVFKFKGYVINKRIDFYIKTTF